MTAHNSRSTKAIRPMTATSKVSLLRSTVTVGETNEDERSKDRNLSEQKSRKMRVYAESKSPIKDPIFFGINIRTGKRVGRSSERGVLMKKYVTKTLHE